MALAPRTHDGAYEGWPAGKIWQATGAGVPCAHDIHHKRPVKRAIEFRRGDPGTLVEGNFSRALRRTRGKERRIKIREGGFA